jgi:hypothetical protein
VRLPGQAGRPAARPALAAYSRLAEFEGATDAVEVGGRGQEWRQREQCIAGIRLRDMQASGQGPGDV